MNSLRERARGKFRQIINEPAAEAESLRRLVLSGLGAKTNQVVMRMVDDWRSPNHSWAPQKV